jgi:2-dehydro-3-deoxygluconokinase
MGKKVITFGEVMIRLATPNHKRITQTERFKVTFGGGEANAAISLANYGMDAEFVTRLPDNELAKKCVGVLRTKYVGVNHIIYGGNRMGLYYLETGASMRGSKVVYDRQHSAFAEIKPGMINWEAIFEDAGWFHWSGITPALSQEAADACLEAIKIAHKMGLTISCDINNRFSLWKYGKTIQEILPEMIQYCDVILASKQDMATIFDIHPLKEDLENTIHTDSNDVAEYESVCKQFIKQYPKASKIFTTFRDSISASHNRLNAVLFNREQLFKGPLYDIPDIIDRVGAGDSFMGGMIYGLLNFNDQKAINFAETASFLKHTIYGDFNRVTLQEIEDVMNGVIPADITYYGS